MVFLLRGRGAHLAAERSPSRARADGARRSVAVPNGEGEAPGRATEISNLLRLSQWFCHFPSPRVPVEYRPFHNVKCLVQ